MPAAEPAARVRTDVSSIPAEVPYLSAPPDRIEVWQKRLGPPARPRIGIAWSGNPQFRNDRNRSLQLETLSPLLDLPGHSFHVLQKDIREADRASLRSRPGIADDRHAMTDFAETAALVSLMDLVVTADTSIAHLAGALGKRTWILLPFAADWRWMRDGERSPWYPTARLFRQRRPGDWGEVMRDVLEALAPHQAGALAAQSP
jgi:hypothetical protein